MESKTITGCPSSAKGVEGEDGITDYSISNTPYYTSSGWYLIYNYGIQDILYNIQHKDNQIDIKVLLPEVKMEDIKLLVEDNVLIIKFLNDKKYTFFNLCLPEFKIVIDSDYELKVDKNAVLQAGVLSLSLTEVRHIKSIKITEG